jgi:hypothetical protein
MDAYNRLFNHLQVVIGKDFKTEENVRLAAQNESGKLITNEKEVGVGGLGYKYKPPLTLKKWNALGITEKEILEAEDSDEETEEDNSSVHEDAGMSIHK